MKLKIMVMGVGLLTVLVCTVFSQDKFSGYMFGDYYYMASNHDADLEGANGFWLRRIYFTYDRGLSDQFSIRMRFEMNTAGDFSSKSKMSPVIKDAYLKWKKNQHSILFGISPTPTWDVIEKFWGYRSVEKTALDLQKFGSSRDFGLSFKGTLDSEKRVEYHLMVANGNSNSSENNEGKKILFALTGKFKNGVLIQGYADFDERPGETNRYTLQGFAAIQKENFRVGVQYAHQNRQVAGGNDQKLQIGSVFGAAKLSDKVWGFARIDRTFDPNPDGNKISYIPFDKTAKSNFIVAGIDFLPAKNVHLIPNIEAVLYSDNDAGTSPDTDVIPRFTLYFSWK